MKEYPAKRTCLVISGYGGGSNGMIAEDNSGLTPLSHLSQGLLAGLNGRTLDVIAFDGHWMACIEAAAEFQDAAKIMVASQGRVDSWDYEERLDRACRYSTFLRLTARIPASESRILLKYVKY